MTTQAVHAKHRVPDYSNVKPLPDPPQQPDMLKQFPGISNFASAVGLWFKDRDDVFVGALGYLWADTNDRSGPYPDGVFAEGLDGAERIFYRNGYVISEVGKPPDLVLEVGSESTGRLDYTVKRDTYASYGVREYWRFDPSGGEYHDAPLGGDTLGDDGEYEPIEIVAEPGGRHWGYSEVLALEIWWDDGIIRFRDPMSGEFLPTLNESEDARQSAEQRAQSEHAARQSAEQRAQAERVARRSAERRIAELEAELRRQRGE